MNEPMDEGDFGWCDRLELMEKVGGDRRGDVLVVEVVLHRIGGGAPVALRGSRARAVDSLALERLVWIGCGIVSVGRSGIGCVSGARFSIGHTVAGGRMGSMVRCAENCQKFGLLAKKIPENIRE